MIHIPVSRWGEPYKSMDVDKVVHFATGEPLAEVSRANGGLVERDMRHAQRARQALVNIFALAAFEDFYSSRQILSDLRDAFAAKGHPGWISTADLVAFLHTLDDRTWDEWNKGKPMKPKDLARLLEPFGDVDHP